MRDIKDYEGLYAITSCGRVWSYRSKKFLKPSKAGQGYLVVNLSKDGKAKQVHIHRLVAEAYLPNPFGLPQVNHKDECKEHCWLNNLEWCDCKTNINYGTRNKRAGEAISIAHRKPVYCVELDKTFDSVKQAAEELKLHAANIAMVCRGERKTIGGYHFKYKEVC